MLLPFQKSAQASVEARIVQPELQEAGKNEGRKTRCSDGTEERMATYRPHLAKVVVKPTASPEFSHEPRGNISFFVPVLQAIGGI